MTSLPALIDSFGRVHDSLRISVTDRCNLRCFYCMPAENVVFMDRKDLLSFEEIERLVKVLVPVGISKLRLTGGEPLVRRELSRLVGTLAKIPEIREIGLTTNGLLLADQAADLYAAGLRRLNVSLDALGGEKFKQITRREGYEQVLEGITAAQKAGFEEIKVNAVSVRGLTEDEIVPFGHFARRTGIEVRFIEYMPLDADAAWEREKVLFADEIIERLTLEFGALIPLPDKNAERPGTKAPAVSYQFADGIGRIGLIASVSHPFCESCNRCRLTADGKFRNCLFSLEETDLRQLLRNGGTDDEIRAAVRDSIQAKWEGHEINTSRFIQPLRPMYSIGG